MKFSLAHFHIRTFSHFSHSSHFHICTFSHPHIPTFTHLHIPLPLPAWSIISKISITKRSKSMHPKREPGSMFHHHSSRKSFPNYQITWKYRSTFSPIHWISM